MSLVSTLSYSGQDCTISSFGITHKNAAGKNFVHVERIMVALVLTTGIAELKDVLIMKDIALLLSTAGYKKEKHSCIDNTLSTFSSLPPIHI